MIFNVFVLNKNMVANAHDGRSRRRRACDHFHFDWERVRQDAVKFRTIPCHKAADHGFLYKAIALTQSTIAPFALWDALEAVKQIRPRVPIAYFRTVLADNCRKAGVDLVAALRTVKVPEGFVATAIIKQLESSALDAHRHGRSWGVFFAQHRETIGEVEPLDRAAYRRLADRLLKLVVSGDSGDTFPGPGLLRDWGRSNAATGATA